MSDRRRTNQKRAGVVVAGTGIGAMHGRMVGRMRARAASDALPADAFWDRAGAFARRHPSQASQTAKKNFQTLFERAAGAPVGSPRRQGVIRASRRALDAFNLDTSDAADSMWGKMRAFTQGAAGRAGLRRGAKIGLGVATTAVGVDMALSKLRNRKTRRG